MTWLARDHFDCLFVVRKLKGVAEQINQNLLRTHLVNHYPELVGLGNELDLNLQMLGLNLKNVNYGLNDVVKKQKRLQTGTQFVHLEKTCVHVLLDLVQHEATCVGNDCQVFLQIFGNLISQAGGHLNDTADRREKLMAAALTHKRYCPVLHLKIMHFVHFCDVMKCDYSALLVLHYQLLLFKL